MHMIYTTSAGSNRRGSPINHTPPFIDPLSAPRQSGHNGQPSRQRIHWDGPQTLASPSFLPSLRHSCKPPVLLMPFDKSAEDDPRSRWAKVRARWQEIAACTLFALGLALLFASVFSTDSECTEHPPGSQD